jgi:predicted MFS family arabinose efflux permease
LDRLLGALPQRFYLVAFAGFLYQMGPSMTQPILTLHYLGIGATIMVIGGLVSIQSVLLIFFRFPLTIFSQRLGERRVLIFAYVVQFVALSLTSLIKDPVLLIIIPLVQLSATALFFPLTLSMCSNMASSERQGDAVGRVMTILSSSGFIGPAVTSLLLRWFPYATVIQCAALFPLVGLVVYSIVTRNTISECNVSQNVNIPRLTTLRNLLGQRNVLILALIRVLYSTSNNVFVILFSLYAVKTLSLDTSFVAALFSIQGFANFSLKVPSGWLSDKIGRKTVLLATFSLIILTYLAFAFFNAPSMLALAIFSFGALWGIRAVTEWAFLASIVSPDVKTLSVSFMESFWDAGSAFGGFVAGTVAGFLPYTTIFLLLAVLNVPALPSILMLKEKRHERR